MVDRLPVGVGGWAVIRSCGCWKGGKRWVGLRWPGWIPSVNTLRPAFRMPMRRRCRCRCDIHSLALHGVRSARTGSTHRPLRRPSTSRLRPGSSPTPSSTLSTGTPTLRSRWSVRQLERGDRVQPAPELLAQAAARLECFAGVSVDQAGADPEAFFTDHLMTQRQASAHTVAAYRNTFRAAAELRAPAAGQDTRRPGFARSRERGRADPADERTRTAALNRLTALCGVS